MKHGKNKNNDDDDDDNGNGNGDYRSALYDLQVELVNLQRQLISEGSRVLVILEGRDGAGKDGAIKRLTAHMSPRETRIYAPVKPSDREVTQWYFQRFVPFLPSGQEFVVFNRSWYNRAGVERVMGYCSETDVQRFFDMVVDFEAMLTGEGILLRKYYLDISHKEQKKRLAARRKDPLKRWKISPVDNAALQHWDDYTKARDEMFHRTSHPAVPWRIVRSDTKKVARLAFMRDLLDSFSYKDKKRDLVVPDRNIVFPWSEAAEQEGVLAK